MVVNIEYFVSMFCISIKNISVYNYTYLLMQHADAAMLKQLALYVPPMGCAW